MNVPPAGGRSRVFRGTWGTEFVRGGESRFRLWAPGVDRLSLRLGGRERGMDAVGDGWFETSAAGASPGMDYAFVLPDGRTVPDPASRAQHADVHGPSRIVDPAAYAWVHRDWIGRPWEEAVLYEMHVGTFTAEGTFRAAAERLGHLAGLGVTAIEIMPVAQFPGVRGWGYDGVLPYAPHCAYGTPEELKALIDAAHGHRLMVLLDVVYNHFGPEGNHLHAYAPDFFHPGRQTPWGAAIAYEKQPVRRFFVENALHWIEEYNLDGLRLDAIDQIGDAASPVHLLDEIAGQVRSAHPGRHVHLTTEDNRNVTRLHERDTDGRPMLYTAEWNDDFHNAAHVIATNETEGYYADFADGAPARLARALAEGFAYQGERSRHSGRSRGEPSAHLPPAAFIDFLQNHDQVGNRALGERLISLAEPGMVKALTAMLLLSPHIPMLFMGEEFGETRPFCFFTDFRGALADAVREGRRREFAGFSAFGGGNSAPVPDPNAAATFEASKLDWARTTSPDGRDWMAFMERLIALRRRHVIPLLKQMSGHAGRVVAARDGVVAVDWEAGAGLLQMRANLDRSPHQVPAVSGDVILAQPQDSAAGFTRSGVLAPAAVLVCVGRREVRA